jgi:peptidoglycan/xylan/chitin deacetylase (PgdA/CDA1 family)
MISLRTQAARLLTTRPTSALARGLKAGRGTIFMLHRFAKGPVGRENAPVSTLRLRTILSMLREGGYSFVPLSDFLDRLESGSAAVGRSICFTVDDGYADFYEIAAPVLREFECPATVFLTTGFLDGEIWLWWDQLQFMFENSEGRTLSLELGNRSFTVSWHDEASRIRAIESTSGALKKIPDVARRETMAQIAEILGSSPPATPPPDHAPLTWDQVRILEGQGFTFGPHSVTHPILSQMDDVGSLHEITESWARLKAETRTPEPVFAYPNGTEGDFSAREGCTIRDLGLRAALTAREDYVISKDLSDSERRFAIPRFGFPEDVAGAVQIATGINRLRFFRSRRR